MKLIQTLFVAVILVIAASTTQAAPYVPVPPYHVDPVKGGYFGSVTFKAKGSCGFRAQTYKNAWFAELFDSVDEPVGWGIMTASGQLLVLEEDSAIIKYSENKDTGVGKDISYTSMVGPELFNFITSQSGCSIWSIVPNTNSRATIKWDDFRMKDRLQLKANYSGFEQGVCKGPVGYQQCSADAFSGSVVFKGDRFTPH